MDKKLEEKINAYLEHHTEKQLHDILDQNANGISKDDVLTIICDDVVHKIPKSLLHGELFVMSQGNFDTTSEKALSQDLSEIADRLTLTLKMKEWKNIRIIFSGHAILGALAKYLAYRICHLETTDVIYFGASGYYEFDYKLRDILVKGRK